MQRASLVDYAAFYVRLMDSSPGYFDQLRFAINRFELWVGRKLFIDELTETLVNDYLAETKDVLSGTTRLSRRNMLLRLWRHAVTNAALEIKPKPLNRDLIGKVKRIQTSPRGWSVKHVGTLLETADGLRGLYRRKISKRLYWRAYVLAAWSTGLRRCDLMSLHGSDIPDNGRMVIVQRKTGRSVVIEFNPQAMKAIRELCAQHKQPLIFPLWCRLSTWRKIARKIVARAGIGLSIGHLRHSAGTEVENKFPGKGPQFLGNSAEIFFKHYYDRTLAEDVPKPRSLDGR